MRTYSSEGCADAMVADGERADQAFGGDGYNTAYDEGITYAIRMLADLTGSKDWQMKDGSEDHKQDVCDTIMDVLKCAGLYDDETCKFATLSPADCSTLDSEGRKRGRSKLVYNKATRTIDTVWTDGEGK